MPRLALEISRNYSASAKPAADPYGRKVRDLAGVTVGGPKRARPLLLHPLFLKVAGWLTVIAALAMAIAIWRLFHFPR